MRGAALALMGLAAAMFQPATTSHHRPVHALVAAAQGPTQQTRQQPHQGPKQGQGTPQSTAESETEMNPDNVKDTSQPAFPATEAHGLNSGTYGMTLRDYFAAKALQGLLASETQAPPDVFATAAYQAADAMLKAREA